MDEGRLEQVKKDLRKLKHGDYYDTHDFAIALGESVNLADELAAEVEMLRGRLEAVCDVVSDSAAYGDDIAAAKVLEAVRGEREARERFIGFDEIREGDMIRVSFPPRGGMSDNWTIEYGHTAIAYALANPDEPMRSRWTTYDGQTLVARLDDRAKIELLSRL